MAVVHKSTIKRARQAEKRRLRNRAVLTSVKTHIKKVLAAVEQKNVEQAQALLRQATSAIAKAAAKGVLKKNTASRRISRLATRVNALTAPRA